MQKNLGSDTEDSKAFGMLWKFYKAYYVPEDNEEYWSSMIQDGNALIKSFPGVNVLPDLVAGIIYSKEKELNGEDIKRHITFS